MTASSCTRGGLLTPGRIRVVRCWSQLPRAMQSHTPQRFSRDVWTGGLGAWISGGWSSIRLVVGHDDLKGLLQPERFSKSLLLCLKDMRISVFGDWFHKCFHVQWLFELLSGV